MFSLQFSYCYFLFYFLFVHLHHDHFVITFELTHVLANTLNNVFLSCVSILTRDIDIANLFVYLSVCLLRSGIR